MPGVRGGAVWAAGEGRTGGKERARDREGRHRPGQPAVRGAGGGRSLPAQVRGARGHARVERRQEEGEGGRGHPESEEGAGGGRAGARPRKGLRPRALALPALTRLFSRPFTRSVFPASPGSGSHISGGLGGAGESGVTVCPGLSWGAGPPVGRRPSLSGSAHPGTCA